MGIEKIRNGVLTEDVKMEMIADYLKDGNAGIETVSITAPTGTLSDEDYAKISKDNTVITASTEYYYKQYSAATVIRYGAIPRLGAGKIIFDYIDIDKATKTFELKYEAISVA